MSMFHEGNRNLQDRYGGRAVADKIVEMVESTEISDDFKPSSKLSHSFLSRPTRMGQRIVRLREAIPALFGSQAQAS